MNKIHWIKLKSLSSIDLTGEGVTQFLDGQLSIDTKTIEDKIAKLACFCNHKGRIVALFHILLIEDGMRLILPQSIMDAVLAHIKKYVVFFKVKVETNTTEIFGSQIDNSNIIDDANHTKIDQTSLIISFNQKNHQDSEDSFWFAQLARNKIAWLTQDTLEHFLPHSLNLPALKAVDFKKGCFTGQEVIARMQYKGKLKQHLQRLDCLQPINIDNKQKLYQAEKAVGEVVCSIKSEEQNTIVLAIIKDSANLSRQFQTSPENSPILEITS
jgi:folate-binding protein YgfZ